MQREAFLKEMKVPLPGGRDSSADKGPASFGVGPLGKEQVGATGGGGEPIMQGAGPSVAARWAATSSSAPT